MRKIIHLKSVSALAGAAIVLGSGAGAAKAEQISHAADVHVVAATVIPVSTPSSSLALRPTTVGPIVHDGQLVTLPALDAAVPVSVEVRVHAEATGGGTVSVTSSDPATAVTVTESRNDLGQHCFGLGVDFTAAVTVMTGPGLYAGTTAKANASVVVKVGDAVAFDYSTEDIGINGGDTVGPLGHHETLPVVTGADLCLPAEVNVALDPAVEVAAVVVTHFGIG
jgi:hypothetical protein